MKKSSFSLLALIVLILSFSCSDNEQFMIEKGKVGSINTKTLVSELPEIFKNDSIVSHLSEGALGNNYFEEDDEYLIYDKQGKHLLTIIPKEQLDTSSVIKSIQIFDNRFQTKSGLNIRTRFLDLRANNRINKIESSFSSAILFLDDLNVTLTIDKEELGLKTFSKQRVTLDQIPDLARIKSFTVWFN